MRLIDVLVMLHIIDPRRDCVVLQVWAFAQLGVSFFIVRSVSKDGWLLPSANSIPISTLLNEPEALFDLVVQFG